MARPQPHGGPGRGVSRDGAADAAQRVFDNVAEGLLLAELVRTAAGVAVEYRVLSFNRAYAELTGPSESRAVADGAIEPSLGCDPRWLAAADEATRTGRPTRFETRAAVERWLDIRIAAVAGDVFTLTAVDITERRRQELALRMSAARFNLAQAALGLGVWDWDLEANHIEWTPQMYELTGIDPKLRGAGLFQAWLEILHPEDREPAEEAVLEASRSNRGFGIDYRVVSRDGEVRWMRSLAALASSGEGAPARMTGVLLDITDLRRGQQRLIEINEALITAVDARTSEFEAVWQMSPEPLVITDLAGRWLRASPAWERILGWTEADFLGRTVDWLIHPDDLAHTHVQRAHLRNGGAVTRLENRLRAKSGEYHAFAWTARLHHDRSYCAARDVTTERLAATELEAAQEALRQTQKMDAIGQLTGGVAHDFNNLLTPIIGSLELVQRRGDALDERSRRLLDGAAQSAERARVLVQRLLAFARRQPLSPGRVDVCALVEGITELITRTVGPQINLETHLPPDLPSAHADVNQLEMALVNLAVNARDAMPEGGRLILGVAAVERFVEITVADTGSGMDAATLQRAVEPFFSTKGVGKGTGLGLSMVHGLAGQLGGSLDIDSRPGAGTVVRLRLPVALDAPTAAPATPAELRAASPRARGIALLVDDEPLVRATAAHMLEDFGFEVVATDSAEQALARLEEGLAPHLLVTDHLMPGLTGVELARRARVRFPRLPVLLVSGYSGVDGVAADLARLAKPFRQAELAVALTAIGAMD